MQTQVKQLHGPIELRTFVSLSCENCPEVVQLLNQFSLVHPEFRHTMIDGDLAQNEVAKLKIGAVPAIFVGNELLISGKVGFVAMLEKLKTHFGVKQSSEGQPEIATQKHYDVLVVGGGPAGASAAIYTARKGLSTAIVAERMGGQVADTQGIENMISNSYTVGSKLVDDITRHIKEYPIDILENRRVDSFQFGESTNSPELSAAHKANLSSGEVVTFRQLIFATGAKWRELNVPGEKEYLGRGVAFCPHCDGPIYKGKEIAVIGGGNSGVEAAIDLAGICKKITLLEFSPELKADQVLVERLRKTSNIHVVTNAQTIEVVGDGTTVTALKYKSRATEELLHLPLAGVFVQIGLVPNSSTLKGLVETTKFGEIVIDARGRTSRTGVYAAGDVTTVPYKQIVISMGEGAKAALAAFEDRLHG